MRKVIWRVFTIWNYDKEEDWLNDMSSKGLQLVNPGIARYTFEEGTPGEYQYRIEFLDHWPNHPESDAYIRFMEEAGVEYMGSVKNWVYFRKKASDGPFDLFNNIDSRLNHIRKIFRLMAFLTPLMLYWVVYTFTYGTKHFDTPMFFCAVLFSVMSCFMLYGTVKLGLKIRKLKLERRIHE